MLALPFVSVMIRVIGGSPFSSVASVFSVASGPRFSDPALLGGQPKSVQTTALTPWAWLGLTLYADDEPRFKNETHAASAPNFSGNARTEFTKG